MVLFVQYNLAMLYAAAVGFDIVTAIVVFKFASAVRCRPLPLHWLRWEQDIAKLYYCDKRLCFFLSDFFSWLEKSGWPRPLHC